ncbi:hypothetical protein M0804_004811 [Polistes exclamans]|nr:hypothetical protein M0804_004811 [Polistes exclamans]
MMVWGGMVRSGMVRSGMVRRTIQEETMPHGGDREARVVGSRIPTLTDSGGDVYSGAQKLATSFNALALHHSTHPQAQLL